MKRGPFSLALLQSDLTPEHRIKYLGVYFESFFNEDFEIVNKKIYIINPLKNIDHEVENSESRVLEKDGIGTHGVSYNKTVLRSFLEELKKTGLVSYTRKMNTPISLLNY